MTNEGYFQNTEVSKKGHLVCNFVKTVNLDNNGLTSVNSLCSISSQEITKKGQFSSCPSELNVDHSARLINSKTHQELLCECAQLFICVSGL